MVRCSNIDFKLLMFRYGSPIWPIRHLLVAFLTPVILCPLLLFFDEDDEQTKMSMRCAYVIAIMVINWTTESMPIAATAFLPLVCYPLLGVAKSNEIAPQYFTESTMAFFGSIFVISALQQANVHRRFALAVLNIVGAQPRWLLAGVMVVPWFLSMWMANTMTTLLLVPIISGLIEEMRNAVERSALAGNKDDSEVDLTKYGNCAELVAMRTTNSSFVTIGKVQSDASLTHLAKIPPKMHFDAKRLEAMLLLSVAYASSIGGFTTVLGTPGNMILKPQVDLAFEERGCPSPLNFMSFMIFALPISAIFLVLAWFWLQIAFCGLPYAFGLKPSPYDSHKDTIRRSLGQLWQNMPPMRYRQWAIIVHCVAMVVLLITRQLNTKPLVGWEVIAPGYAKESVVTFLVAISLFVFPGNLPTQGRRHIGGLINWKDTEKDFPIGVLLLIGGGTAAAFGAEKSGLAEKLSKMLYSATLPLNDRLTVFIIVTFVVLVTEVMSNTACVTLMMPILKRLADMRGKSPLLFMFPVALGTSFAFMFPVSTPPNAIIFGTGRLKMTQMIGVGCVMNAIGIGVLNLGTNTWGDYYFNFYGDPTPLSDYPNITCF